MRQFDYREKWKKLLTPEIVSYLTRIHEFKGGPVGLDTLAAALGEDAGTLEDVYEPYLLQNGFLNRTSRGRVATQAAYKHLGIAFPE